jgi:hypothetical protein
MKAGVLLAIVGMVLGHACGAAPQENATLPYKTLCGLVALDLKGVMGVTNQEIRLTITSKTPGVNPSDIRLYIDSRDGRIPIPLNADGTFSLPIVKTLLSENPNIVANQPKGTMELEGRLAFGGPLTSVHPADAGDRQRYQTLFFLEDIKARLATIDCGTLPMSNAMAHSVVAVQLIPQSDTATATVVVESVKGRIVVPRDSDGTFRLRQEPALSEENPWVLMPTNHKWKVITDLQADAEQPPRL